MKCLKKFNLNKQKKRFISNLIGSIIYLNAIITPMGIGQYSVYITSYLHNYNSKINIQLGNIMMPILMLFLSLSSPLGGILEHKLGMHLTFIISTILLEFLIFIFVLQRNIWITFILIILIGINVGSVITIPGKNICFYYPEKKGMIMALTNSFMFICAAITNVVGEKIINPNKIILKKDETYYPLYVSKNYIKFFKIILMIIPINTIISLLLIRKYDPIYNNEQLQKLNKDNESSDNKKDEYYSKNIKAAIFNSRIWKIAAVSIFSEFVINFVLSTFRVYGALISINGTIMQYFPILFALSNIIFGPLWGYINDKLQNFKICKIICLFFIIHSIILAFFIQSNLIYIISIFVGSIFVNGIHNIVQPHVMKIYGIKYCIEIGGVINISTGIVNILKAGLSFIISFYYHTGKELQKPYRIIFLCGIGFNAVGYYFASKEKEDLFIYPYSLNDNNQKNVSIQSPINEVTIENGNKNI